MKPIETPKTTKRAKTRETTETVRKTQQLGSQNGRINNKKKIQKK